MGLGERIKKYRIEREITQVGLAELIGKSPRMIQKYESNDVTPSLEVIGMVAKTLKVDWLDLIEAYFEGDSND